MVEIISSASNPLIKSVRMLANRKHRQRTGTFLVEGIQPVWQAIEAGVHIDVLLVAPGLLAGSPALQVLADPVAPIVYLTNDLFARLSTRDRPAGLAAVVRSTYRGLDDLPVESDSLFVALHLIGNPGNLGTIIRTAVSTGVSAVLLLDHTADPFAPSAVRASMGAIFAVPIVPVPDAETLLQWSDRRRLTVVTTSPAAERNHWATAYPLPGVLVLGGERDGRPGQLLDHSDVSVRIPMAGTADSLNAAIAAGVMLYEMRRRHPLANWNEERRPVQHRHTPA